MGGGGRFVIVQYVHEGTLCVCTIVLHLTLFIKRMGIEPRRSCAKAVCSTS